MAFATEAVRVRVPATSANLGPGFDSAGLCLALYDEVTVAVRASGLSVLVSGEGHRSLPRTERHLVVAAMRRAFDRLGAGQPPGLAVSCRNAIPQSRGLGSSSAAICAALLAARALVVGCDQGDDDLLQLADEVEGHPDNVAACLRGGFTLAWHDDHPAGRTRVVRRDAHPDLAPVLYVPEQTSSTREVRALLPASVRHVDAAANAARAGLLALAVTGDPALLLAATADRLHQAYRAAAMPRTAALVAALRAGGTAAVVSGAGPSVLALATRAQAPGLVAAAPEGWQVRAVPVDPLGAVVLPGPVQTGSVAPPRGGLPP